MQVTTYMVTVTMVAVIMMTEFRSEDTVAGFGGWMPEYWCQSTNSNNHPNWVMLYLMGAKSLDG